jgi:hypothetical protein
MSFTICTLHKTGGVLMSLNQEAEMGRTYDTHGEDGMCISNFARKILNGRDNFEYLSIYLRKIFKLVLKNLSGGFGLDSSGSRWRLAANFFEHGNAFSGFIKCRTSLAR